MGAVLATALTRASDSPARTCLSCSTLIQAPTAVSVQTHAWIEAAVPGLGWYALDPTNGGAVGERHVVIGHGRDYNDVPPVRGVFNGVAEAEVEAEVIMAQPTAPPSMVTEPIRRQARVAVGSPAELGPAVGAPRRPAAATTTAIAPAVTMRDRAVTRDQPDAWRRREAHATELGGRPPHDHVGRQHI